MAVRPEIERCDPRSRGARARTEGFPPNERHHTACVGQLRVSQEFDRSDTSVSGSDTHCGATELLRALIASPNMPKPTLFTKTQTRPRVHLCVLPSGRILRRPKPCNRLFQATIAVPADQCKCLGCSEPMHIFQVPWFNLIAATCSMPISCDSTAKLLHFLKADRWLAPSIHRARDDMEHTWSRAIAISAFHRMIRLLEPFAAGSFGEERLSIGIQKTRQLPM